MMSQSRLLKAIVYAILAAIVIPLLVVVGVSFNLGSS
jgi:ABC-type spermidine/putrescine transport system permease subunit II